MNLVSIHKELVSRIKGYGFMYLSPERWINYETGEFPVSNINRAFTIKVEIDENMAVSVSGVVHLTVQVEYVLSAIKDEYLSYLPEILKALGSVQGMADAGVVSDIVTRSLSPRWIGDWVIYETRINLVVVEL